MKKISELKKIFEDLAPEKTLDIGLIINNFSFTISKELEDYLQTLSYHAYRFCMSLNVPVRKEETVHFLMFYDYYKYENSEAMSYAKRLATLEGENKISPLPTISISYIFRSRPSNIKDIEKYPEIFKYDFKDYVDLLKLDILFLNNVELDFVYYGEVL